MLPESNSVQVVPAGVSFLICTYNSASRISETLTCLARQAADPAIPWEVILVDNACTDGTTEKAEAHWRELGTSVPLRLFKEPRPGKNFAVKLAFSQARYQYACIVDDDNRLASDYLQIGFDVLQANPQVAIVGGQNIATFEVSPPSWFPLFQANYAVGIPVYKVGSNIKPLPDGNIGSHILWGAGMFIRLELWHKLTQLEFKSLFAGRQGTKVLTAGEDDELCYVAQLLGYEVWYWSGLRLEHYMTANRLTPTYRNRLYYSPVWAASRLGAYRSALLTANESNSDTTTHLVKDFLYMSWGAFRQIVSMRFVKALFIDDKLYLMDCKQQMLTIFNYILDFGNIIGYYKYVDELKQKIKKSGLKLGNAMY
ncbi:glycosyltransferase [Hymenobacter radiodurans]|uniref:glycosyltransferase n=1 Tax=Hymenobacter radiodurans TaxID=2496028 RepID=UPI001058F9F0|nr:glycosyltransferase [Hymenobacter radiodurans]